MEQKLWEACKDGKVEEARRLLQNSRININWQNQNYYLQTPFHITCAYGHTDIVKLLLNDNRVDVNTVRDDGWTPFHIACYNGHLEIVKLLLNDKRVVINKTTNGGSTPFLIACYNGKTKVVKYMLESGREIDINQKDNDGKTCLDWARQEGNTDIVKLIQSFQMKIEDGKKYNKIQNEKEKLWQACSDGKVEEVRKLLQNEQININWQNQKGYLTTPFYIACENGHIEIVKLLNDKRIDFNKANEYGTTPFHITCAYGHTEIVKLLLNDNRVDINKARNDGYTPFYSACQNGHLEIVKLLLNDNRVVINKTSNNGRTPFLIACYSGKIEVVKYLLESGREIDINQKDKKGKTGLDIARENGNTDIVKLIESFQMKIEDGKKYNKIQNEKEKLWQACSDGKVEEVQKLLQNEQIDTNWQSQNDYLRTPFYVACENGHIDIVKILLNDKRIDFNKTTNGDCTPFYIACEKGHVEIVKLLLNDERVDINKADDNGYTPFNRACYGRIELIKLLINGNRVDINKADKHDRTPFYIACLSGRIELVELLLNDKRVDINKANSYSWTPFYIACQNGKTEVVKYLLESEREIDINQKDKKGKTGLDIARQEGNTDIVKLIESFQMKIEDEKKKLEEEKRKKEESKKSNFEIEHNGKLYKLKTTAKTLSELRSAIKTKVEVEESEKIVLEFKENGNFFVLNDMEDLEDGMRIKVTISAQSQSDSTNVNNECWWNTKPNEKTKWEEKGYLETKYIRSLLRENKKNVVGNENEYLKKLELLMTFFGGDMKQVNKAYVLFNEKLFDSFQNHRASLFNQQRTSPANFKKEDWQNGNDAQKFKFHNHYTKIAENFKWNRSEFLHAIPMIHGTSETALQEICQTGLAPTGATDDGFYGQGMYFSSSLFYSSKYSKDSPDGKPFIICMITPGNVYPENKTSKLVTESPYLEGRITIENPEGFIRRPCKLGYQSHYTLVDNRKLNDAYPITGNIDGNVANELVVFEKAQVLPLFAIYFK